MKERTIKTNGSNGTRNGARPAPSPVRVRARSGRGSSGLVWPPMASPADAQALALMWQLNQTERWSEGRLAAHQLKQIEGLIRHAVTQVRFHRERLSAFVDKLSPNRLTMDAFRTLPIMTRSDIQTAGNDLVAQALPASHGQMFPVRSSGSTGRPIEVRGTGVASIYLSAFTMRGHLWHKRDLAAKNVDVRTAFTGARARRRRRWSSLPGSGPSVRIDIALSIDEIFKQLIKEDPAYLQTHPYTLLGLVEHSKEIGLKPASLREARTFGEALDPAVRETISQTWNVPVIENYSATEIGTIAHQCPETTNLHVQAEGVLVEVLNDIGEPCGPNETGRVVLTALQNFATPLIRYEIGDYATVGEACVCGRGLPVLVRVLGRERNLLVYPDGTKRFPEIRVGGFDQIAPIRQFQLVQKTLEELELRLVMPRPLSEDEEQVMRRFMLDKFGYPFNVEIVYHDDLPRAANGKFEEFRSEVS